MTAIVGLVDGGKVIIGGDSAGVAGWDITVRADVKVFAKADMVFGFAGSFRVGQLLRYRFGIPANHEADDMTYLVGPFIDSLRQCLKDGGVARTTNGEERGGDFLLGYRGHLYQVANDYQVGESSLGFNAIGCGDNYALGSLFTSTGKGPARVRRALEAAEMLSAGVVGPFCVVTGGAA